MPRRGEVWLVDFGLAQKIRPALILSTAYSDADRALVTVISHTTKIRGSKFELPSPRRFLSQAHLLCKALPQFRRSLHCGGSAHCQPRS
jgi:mRNA-degrading endonuclease toxin of MazEF toxin-antitoxin module